MKNIFKKLVSVSVFLFLPYFVHAAALSFSPNAGGFAVGQTFVVNLLVSSQDQAMNAVSGAVSFPADQLEVASLSKGGSIVGLWVQEPSFSNQAGTVNFEGVVLNPGFTGSAGRILSISFRAKKSGLAKLSLIGPAILANDGAGTNILYGAGKATFQISQGSLAPTATPSPAVPGTLVIASITHPDQNKWYSAGTAQFNLDLPEQASAVRLLLDQKPASEPNVVYSPPIKIKTVADLTDGVWYFHAQAETAQGWDPAAHFRLQIDTKVPESFELKEVPRPDPNDQRPQLSLIASDSGSGIDHYEIKVDGQSLAVVPADGGASYQLPELDSGPHTIIARAVDRGRNALERSLEINIPPSAYSRWGVKTVTALSLAVPLLALIILLGLMLERSHSRFRRWRRRVQKEVHEAEESITQAFDNLLENVEKQLLLLEKTKTKRELTREESRILVALRKNLRSAEKLIKKEVEKIEEVK